MGRGCDAIVSAVHAHLTHELGVVRCAAVQALANTAAVGDAATIQTVATLSSLDPEATVREVAIETLVTLAQRGDATAIAAVYERLADSRPTVRKVAMEAL